MKRTLPIILWFWILLIAAAGMPSKSLAQDAAADVDKQAGYCMQAEFDFSSQNSRLVSLLENNAKIASTALAQKDLPSSDKEKFFDALNYAEKKMPEAKADGKAHMDSLNKIMYYLNKRGLMKGDGLQAVTNEGYRAQEDAREKQTIYRACLSNCPQGDSECKDTCEKRADNSEFGARLQACDIFSDNLPSVK